jgi:hypothetical protein
MDNETKETGKHERDADTKAEDVEAEPEDASTEKKAKTATDEDEEESAKDRVLDEIADYENADAWLDAGQTCGPCETEFYPSSVGCEGVGSCSKCGNDICSGCFYSSEVTKKCVVKHKGTRCVHDDDDDTDECLYDKEEPDSMWLTPEEPVSRSPDQGTVSGRRVSSHACRRGIVCVKCVYADYKERVKGTDVARSMFLRAKYQSTVSELRELERTRPQMLDP